MASATVRAATVATAVDERAGLVLGFGHFGESPQTVRKMPSHGRSRPTRHNGPARTFTQVRLTFRRERAIPNDSQSGCSLFELYYDI